MICSFYIYCIKKSTYWFHFIGYLIYTILASNRISKEGKEFVSKITGYTLENEDDFVQGNKVEITNI